jgi:hypothetical protein
VRAMPPFISTADSGDHLHDRDTGGHLACTAVAVLYMSSCGRRCVPASQERGVSSRLMIYVRCVAAPDGPKSEKKFIDCVVLHLRPVTERPGATEPTVPLAQPI